VHFDLPTWCFPRSPGRAATLRPEQALGGRIVEAERTLARAFAAGRIDQASLQAQVGAIATLQGERRAVHLAAHLTQRALLTPEQVARYDALRGYQGGATPPGGHPHGRH
jgi:Spy/CpxP family protein refolding chaperone